ncbi:hypothetical protein BDR05DRAFT_950298 [Suillus weaverae]|nr:hypothetical protein BDR05DRAFT_950298 [Suillus weaverae]
MANPGSQHQNQMAELLKRGIGIWPTQLPRYAEAVVLKDDEIEDTLISMKEIYRSSPFIIRDWQEFVHPMGGTYYYNNKKDLQRLDDFIDASRFTAKEDGWVLVVYPTIFMGEERFQYYYVVSDYQVIAWLEDMDGHILFGECIQPSKWRHKRLELEAQYWKHFEFFPHNFQMNVSQMNQVVTQLASIEELAENQSIEESGVVFCCHYQYLHRHNQPEARLIQSHAAREKRQKNRLVSFFGSAAAIVLCMPLTVERIQATSVDGIVNGVEVRRFVNDFSNQAKNQITLAGVAMALDVAILAVLGLGTSVFAQTSCSCSLLLGVGCIFASIMVQHFGEKMGSLDFAAYYLCKKRTTLIIITSIPTFFCVLRSNSDTAAVITNFTLKIEDLSRNREGVE